jgi:hypothetical protein
MRRLEEEQEAGGKELDTARIQDREGGIGG